MNKEWAMWATAAILAVTSTLLWFAQPISTGSDLWPFY